MDWKEQKEWREFHKQTMMTPEQRKQADKDDKRINILLFPFLIPYVLFQLVTHSFSIFVEGEHYNHSHGVHGRNHGVWKTKNNR